MSAPEPGSPAPQKKGRGCFFYGCITCLAIFVLVVAGAFLTGWYLVHTVNGLITDYTDTSPATLPKVDMPADELAALKARVSEFGHALKVHTNTPPLVLDSREINALLEASPQVKQMNLDNAFYVDLEGDQIKGQISLPLDALSKIPFVHAQGRYLNGSGTFTATITNAALSLTIKSLEAKGKPLPPEVMAKLQQQNLVDSVNQNPTNTAAMSHFESIEVKDGTLIITAKPE
jgi:hypothetical protein